MRNRQVPSLDTLLSKHAVNIRAIRAQRQEIVEAFVAQYNLHPDEVEQVLEHKAGEMKFYVRRKNRFSTPATSH